MTERPEIELGIYTGSVGSEHRRLYELLDDAALHGAPFTIIRYGRQLTVTLEAAGCKPCREGRHDDCLQDQGGDPECGCDQLLVHRTILNQRVYAARLAWRPT